ncbi:unnamed protein product [Agarophyton chilense]
MRGDSEFVKRRRTYRDEMHLLRMRFSGESETEQETARARSDVQATDLTEHKNERKARKRERSLQRIKEHKERLRQVQEEKKERVAFKKNVWEEKQKKLVEKGESVVQLLVSEAPHWITDDTLNKHVEQAVDEFFIEGVADARRDEEALRVNGEVRGAMVA